MCDICKQDFCAGACPGCRDEGDALPFCLVCGRPLYMGDTAYELDGDVICEECVEDARIEIGG